MLKLFVPVASLMIFAAPALALEVTKTSTVAASPETVWKTIGGFCGIGEWHPVVEKCALSEKGSKPERTLTLKGGGTLVEEEQARDEASMSYTYTILSGPLPVEDYKSTIMVTKEGDGSKVTWSGDFKAKGATDEKAQEVIGGVYEAGLKSISERAK
ncbi:MxaD protein [Aureimonas sp. Leaf454]|uniref:SRPBCC family protein n=1 Tax=Aureimonas sp. Leaf454 TaxID=1736381 RepID=UPI0006FFDC23|nr:SRPBCC family protein [Aureimonas sp. Leaf454]KQT50280.1 MxaD protein [Aureimonas sp. Leaf454]